MINFLKIVGLIFTVALVIVGTAIAWKYSGFYGNDKAFDTKNITHSDYNFKVLLSERELAFSPPDLPDILPYTVKNIKDNTPEFKKGYVLIQEFSEGVSKLRDQVDVFGDMQGRLNPLVIVLVDGVYSLDDLVTVVDDASLLEKTNEGIFILHVPLSIRAEGTLIVQAGENLYLNSNSGGILFNFGNLYIIDAQVSGWNIEENTPAYFVDGDIFRPYITTWCGSNLYIAGSTVSHMGYNNSKSYGVSYTSCSGTLYDDDFADLPGGTGQIIESNFNDLYFGFYSYEVSDVVILRNKYSDNIIYAIDPHDRSANLIIAYNEISNTKLKHGIIFSRDVENSFVFNNIIESNNGSGIMFDRNSSGNVVAYNISSGNGGDGLTYYESPNNISYQNRLLNNKKVGLRIRNSWGIISFEDIINNNQMGVRLYTDTLPSVRNLDIDSYVKKASMTLIRPEIIGNWNSNFKLTDFDSFEIYKPIFFKSPSKIFSGDLAILLKDERMNALSEYDGVSFIKKQSAND